MISPRRPMTLSGPLPTELANAISSAIHVALGRGMQLDEACSVVIAVVADYARIEYGDGYLEGLAEVVRLRALVPLPEHHIA